MAHQVLETLLDYFKSQLGKPNIIIELKEEHKKGFDNNTLKIKDYSSFKETVTFQISSYKGFLAEIHPLNTASLRLCLASMSVRCVDPSEILFIFPLLPKQKTRT